MKNTKKLLSLALTLALLLSAVFCTGAVAGAEELDTTPTLTSLTLSVAEEEMDWSVLGENKITDSNVSEITYDETNSKWVYADYYADPWNNSTIANVNAWWGKSDLKSEAYKNGVMSAWAGVGARGLVTGDVSHTNDGTGSLNIAGGNTYFPVSSTSNYRYGLLTFWIKSTAKQDIYVTPQNTYNVTVAKTPISVDATNKWVRVIYLVYTGNKKLTNFGLYFEKQSYIDEIEYYDISPETAAKYIDITNKKLLNGKEEYVSGTTFTGTKLTVASDFDLDSLGTNLFPDPTVNEFVDDGNGGKVYDRYHSIDIGDDGATSGDVVIASPVVNPKAIFARHAFKDFTKSTYYYGSYKTQGATVYDPQQSHTNDGSGLIVVPAVSYAYHLLPIGDKLKKNSYYVITFWAKAAANGACVRFYRGTTDIQTNVPRNDKIAVGDTWKRYTYLLYSGSSDVDFYLSLRTDSANCTIYADDFAVYKLDSKYAHFCKTNAKLLTKEQYAAALREADTEISSTTVQLKIPPTYVANTPIDTEGLGKNLVTDPTVADWNGETYNSTGWWTKVPFENKDSVYGSMYTRGYLTNDTTKSHTKDGSGAIAVPGSADGRAVYLPLTLPNKKTYYLVTTWVYFAESNDVQSGFYTQGSTLNGVAKTSENFKGWRQIAWIVYQGANAIGDPSMCLWSKSDFVFDEFSIFELDYEFGKKCMQAGTWVTGASNKEDVAFNANATQTITATDGYFIPYGAVQTADGKIAEKLGNGQFYAATAGNYVCAEFKYPTGTVGTFGASAKTTGTTGIQFGSLITDNQAVTADGTGTLVFRGNFNEFRKTFPTKTRAEVANIIYKALKNANIPDGEAVTLKNGGKSVVVMNVPRTTYMWKNSANTELQYAVRVTNVVGNEYADVDFTAIGYVTKGGKLVFSNEIKTANYNELIPAQN